MRKTLRIALSCLLCLGMAWNALAARASDGIVFSDAVLEQRVRQALGKPEGPITPEDAAALTWLDAEAHPDAPEDEKIKSLGGLGAFANLEGLRLSFHAIHDVSELAKLPRLRGLWLDGNSIEDLNPLGEIATLDNLAFETGFRELPFLKNLTELRELHIIGCRTLPPELLELPNLTVLCAPGGELADISMLKQIPGLTAVDISWNLVTDLTPLTGLPLTELYLQGNPIEDFTPIRDIYPNLVGRDFDYIEVRQPENPDQVIAFPDPVLERKIRAAMDKPKGDITAADAAQVTRLDLHNDWQPQIPQEIQITGLQGMEAFISLGELDAGFNAIGDISALSGLTGLTRLNLGGNAVEDLSPLSGLTQLEELTLYGNGISDLSPLAGLMTLHSLHLGNNPLEDVGALAGLTRIDHLYLDSCGIGDIGPLSGMTGMYRLYLSNNYITDLAPLAGMTNLITLKLENNPIQDYSLIEAIYPNLQDKDFEYGQAFDVEVPLKPERPEAEVPIGDAALEAVLREVTGVRDRPLTQQDLCKIGKFMVGNDNGHIAGDLSVLRYCLNLEGLSIWESNVSDLSPLSGLTRLRHLTVNRSPLSDLTPLRDLARLEYLDVSYNQITDFTPLYGLQNLSVLKISHNLTPDASGFAEIAKGLKEKDFDPGQPMDTAGDAGDGAMDREQGWQPSKPKNPDKIIKFPDKVMEQKVRQAINKPEGPITAKDAAGVDFLNLSNEWQEKFPKGSQIAKLDGIEYFINLKSLDISWNKIKDIKKLSGLTQLEYLRAYGNAIQDVKPLANLTNLTSLNVGGNKIKSLKPLGGLANLTELFLVDNPIKDYSPVAEVYPRLTEKDFEMK